MRDFFAMGGYALYVWSSYGLAVVVLVGLLVASLRSLKSNETLLATLERSGMGPSGRRRARSPSAPADDGAMLAMIAATVVATPMATDGAMGGATASCAGGAGDGGGGGGDC